MEEETKLATYGELLITGRSKKALEFAVSNGFWNHAMCLSFKMGKNLFKKTKSQFQRSIMDNILLTAYRLMEGLPNPTANNKPASSSDN